MAPASTNLVLRIAFALLALGLAEESIGGPIEFQTPMQLQHTRSGTYGVGGRLKNGGVISADNDSVFILGINLNTVMSYPRTVLRGPLAEHPDGGFVCLGDAANIVWRIRADGTRDESFISPPAGTYSIVNFSVQTDGKVLAGCFPPESVIRFNADGSRDNSFAFPPTEAGHVMETIPLANGKILVHVDSRILKLLPSGQLDPTFHIPLFNSFTRDIEVQADGKILVVGDFSRVDGIPRAGLVRFEENGTFDFDFNAVSRGEGGGERLRVQADGRIVVKYWRPILRFLPNGQSDPTFSFPGGTANATTGFEVDSQDRIYASADGTIWQYSGRNRIIALPTESPQVLERSLMIDSGWTLLQTVPANTQGDFLINDFPGTGSTFYRSRPAP